MSHHRASRPVPAADAISTLPTLSRDLIIPPTGLSVLYQPAGAIPVVDIVFVHGLQGHPYKTWLFTPSSDSASNPENPHKKKSRVTHLPSFSWGSSSRSAQGPPAVSSSSGQVSETVHWPSELLPLECPEARILTWGYDTRVTKSLGKAVNKNSIFSHAKDLMCELAYSRALGRRVIFVSHSLGGIVVKEMLHQCSVSNEIIRDILKFTAAVIFLGTPHRGSEELAGIGETVRKISSKILRLDSNPRSLDALGLRSSDLERCQEAFSRLWLEHDFRVKTFQEGLGLRGINLGLLGKKVVPDYSSLLGDPRERAETLQATHKTMCRYSGSDDPNYRKVSRELRDIYDKVQALCLEPKISMGIDSVTLARIDTLRFPQMTARIEEIKAPAERTCEWLMLNPVYRAWFDRERITEHYGLLRIFGNPGSGKSTLMKAAFKNAIRVLAPQLVCVLGFFFNAKGSNLEKSSLGFYLSIVHQLLRSKHATEARDQFLKRFEEPLSRWHEEELLVFLRDIFSEPNTARTIIFVDGLDECICGQFDLAYFLRQITFIAYTAGVSLDVCVSSRKYPITSLPNCLSITMEHFNETDIEQYVAQRLQLGGALQDSRLLMKQILNEADGIFLWVVLAVDILLKERDEGKSLKQLQIRLRSVPKSLEELFSELLSTIQQEDRGMAVGLFQWAALSLHPLRIREWRDILALIGGNKPSSLEEWRESAEGISDDLQLEKRVRTLSRGLVEIRSAPEGWDLEDTEALSMKGGPGSLDQYHGESRVVEVIHESVRQFLISRGFAILEPKLQKTPTSMGHLAIATMCLDYIQVSELDALSAARQKKLPLGFSDLTQSRERLIRRTCSVTSFSSAGSRDYFRRNSTPSIILPSPSKPDKPKHICPIPTCDASIPTEVQLGDNTNSFNRHIWTHFTDTLACPWCSEVKLSHIDAFKTHLEHFHEVSKWIEFPRDRTQRRCALCSELFTPTLLHHHIGSCVTTTVLRKSAVEATDKRQKELERPGDRFGDSEFQPSRSVTLWAEAHPPIFLGPIALEQPSSICQMSAKFTVSSAPPILLENDLPLLNYASMMLFQHLNLAGMERCGADWTRLIKRLEKPEVWERWLSFREDLPRNAVLSDFVSYSRGLKSAVESASAPDL